jgi:transcription antitermination factor NusG
LDLPLFPCYLFTRTNLQNRLQVLQSPGVIGLAASNIRPTTIPDHDIEALRMATEKLRAEPHPFLNVGDRVRIITGPLSGMEGILTRHRPELRVVLSVDLIMRSIAVELSEFEIEPISTCFMSTNFH